MAGMEMEANNSHQPDTRGYQLDASAIEALSAGIGIGSLVNKKKRLPTHQPRTAPAADKVTSNSLPPRTVPKVRFGFGRSVLAWCCDLLIIGMSLLAATTAAHYATTNMLPAPADILFALRERFAAHEVAIASAALLSAYFILFKFLTGFTLGEAILGAKRR